MLTIRFNRTGKKNRASFRIVLQESAKAPNHRHVEVLGSHDPHSKTTVLKRERILHWIGVGAQPSDSVRNLLVSQGVIEGKKSAIKMPRPVKKEEEAPSESGEAKAEETSAAE
ncbi:MAG: 30S ribosomal protein S16 [Candidatus Moranbacteria bacterium]|nr:30S ribosomal protein S16 [Candidatus Moranbacteria bacterium]NTW45637.1 30S ribosomal protein S16 [Candidatus Moranbacteria bacterium]